VATQRRLRDRARIGGRWHHSPQMPGAPRVRNAATIRRDVYRLFLSLTRLVIDPLLAGQLAGAVYDEQAPNATGLSD
jgi:hypothetical protein